MNRTTDKPSGRRERMARNFGASLLTAMICFGLFVSTSFAAGPPANIVAFDPPGAMLTTVYGITSAGVVAGQYEDSNGVYHGFTYDTSGNFVIIDAPGAGTLSDQGTRLLGISEGGEICGYYIDSALNTHGYLRNISGVFTTLDAPDSIKTLATGVNDSEEVAGIYTNSSHVSAAFLWTREQRFHNLRASGIELRERCPNQRLRRDGRDISDGVEEPRILSGCERHDHSLRRLDLSIGNIRGGFQRWRRDDWLFRGGRFWVGRVYPSGRRHYRI